MPELMDPTLPIVAGTTHRLVDIGTTRLHVAEAGRGDPIVLLHGWPQHWYMWRHVIPVLAEHYRVLCVDFRGFGWSEAPPGDYSKQALADDVLALLDALGLDRVRLMGHDWGGYVGFLLCLQRPDRFEQFMPLNIIHPWLQFTAKVAASLVRLPHQVLLTAPLTGSLVLRHRPEFAKLMLWGGTRNHRAWTRAELESFSRRLQQPDRARASVLLYRTWVLHEYVPLLRGQYRDMRLHTPTLMVFGREDPAIRPHGLKGYEPYADDMAIELVPGASHYIVDERPDIVSDRALRFFAGEPASEIAAGPSTGPLDDFAPAPSWVSTPAVS
jgi:pimeloyl-ACP methyl ester carboxylesterase